MLNAAAHDRWAARRAANSDDCPSTSKHTPVKREENMLRTRLCDLLGIDLPIILAGMGAGATSAEFAAAVSNQGGLAALVHFFGPPDVMKRDIDLWPTLTNRNFEINH